MKNLTEYWVEINRLENEADRTYRRLVAEMFNNGLDPIQLMKQGRGGRARGGG